MAEGESEKSRGYLEVSIDTARIEEFHEEFHNPNRKYAM